MASTMKQQRIMWELRQSMGEELAAGSAYMDRAITAEEAGDKETAALYREVARDELEDHYLKFDKRVASVLGISHIQSES